MNKFLLLMLSAYVCVTALTAQNRLRIDDGWRFRLGDDSAFSRPELDDSQWRRLDLPHDWSIEGTFDKGNPMGNDGGYLPAGVAWYRLTLSPDDLQVTSGQSGERVPVCSYDRQKLYFEGVYMNSSVYINGRLAGGHPYGYASFWVDATGLLRPDSANVVAVRVDNSAQKNCRWYTGSGIYRHVWLYGMSDSGIDDPWRLFVRTGQVYGISADGTRADSATVILTYGDSTETRTYRDVSLWSPEHPSLYTLRWGDLTVEHGFRTLSYSAADGLRLNGRPYVLNGGCLHHDNGVIGAAAFDAAEWRKARLMKEAGFNAARTSHNPPAEEFLRACDHLGLLVIDEAFDGLRAKKNDHDYHKYIDRWWQEDVDALVLRDRNHPSVLCWSNGNEVYERKKLEVVTTSRRLAGRMRQQDPTRGVTQALCGWDKDWDIYDPLAETLDIMGYNYLIHYAESDHERVPDRVMWQTESYPAEAFRNWAAVHDHSYVIGDFVWTALDYLGESGIGRSYYASDPADAGEHWQGLKWPWHGAYCGDIDITGWRKPISHYRDILWDEDSTRLYMAVREPNGYRDSITCTHWSVWPTWPSWNWPGHEGRPVDVEVYSRYPRVRLYLDGTLIGEKATTRAEEFKAVFTLPYRAGRLRAVGIRPDGTADESGAQVLETAGPASRIRLTADRTALTADAQDVSFVEVEITDSQGRPVPNADTQLTFRLSGRGTLLAAGSADMTSMDSYAGHLAASETPADPSVNSTTCHAWQGRAVCVIRSGHKTGTLRLTVSGPGLRTQTLSLRVR